MKNESIGYESIVTQRRILFDHVEKCGGRTVSTYLKSVYPPDQIGWFGAECQFEGLEKFYGTETPLCITGHGAVYLIPLLKEIGYETATVLREPVERVKSLYLFCKQEGYISKDATVQQFLITKMEPNNYYAWRFSGIPPGKVRRCPRLARDLALKRLSEFDHVGFTSNLSGFINALGYGVPFDGQRVNVTHYKESISQEDTDLITAANQIDIEIYRIISRLDTC